jgi:hypothetical protein
VRQAHPGEYVRGTETPFGTGRSWEIEARAESTFTASTGWNASISLVAGLGSTILIFINALQAARPILCLMDPIPLIALYQLAR